MKYLEEKMKNWQSISQAKVMIQEYKDFLNDDTDLRKKARLNDKRYHFKELFDEFHPLLEFAELYCKDSAEIRYTGRETQIVDLKYDGEIRLTNGTILTIEIAKPFDGKKYHKNAEQLNLNGYSEVEVGDCFDHAKSIVDKIIETAKNKACKNYQDSILVICPPDMNWYRDLDDEFHTIIRSKVINSLKDITFNAKEVYLMPPRYISSSGDYNGELIKIS